MLARARGSAFEVLTQLEISRNIGVLPAEVFDELAERTSEVARLLSGLMKNLQNQISEAGSPKS